MKTQPRSKTSAQGLVEFALIISLLLLVLFMVLDLGRLAFYYSAVHNAAREGARYGSIYDQRDDFSGIRNTARNLASGVNLPDSNISITCYDAFNAPTICSSTDPVPSSIEVRVQYSFTPASPVLNTLTGNNSYTLESTARMNIEG
jgi:Flp pilus assembly protein TadG